MRAGGRLAKLGSATGRVPLGSIHYALRARAWSLLPAEDFTIYRVHLIERAGAVARETRAVHDGE